MTKVYLIAAVSADGYIARNSHQKIDWTSKEDKKFFKDMTKKSGVMVMGGNTYRTFREPLPGRRHIVYTKGSVDGDAFEKTTLTPKELVAQLESEGYDEIAIIGGGTMYSMFLAAGVVTDVYLTIEPLLFGDGVKFLSENTDAMLKLRSSKKLNENTVLMHYEV